MRNFIKLLTILITLIPFTSKGDWKQLGVTGFNQPIYTITSDDSGNIYAGGSFTNSSGYTYVAKFTKSTGLWSELGTLGGNGIILDIKVDKSGNVYAAGGFTNFSGNRYVAKFDKSVGYWSEFGTGLDANNNINTIAIDDSGYVYAGGRFTIERLSVPYSPIKRSKGDVWTVFGDDNTKVPSDTITIWAKNIYKINITKSGSVLASVMSNKTGLFHIAEYDKLAKKWKKNVSVNNVITDFTLNSSSTILSVGNFTNTSGNRYVNKGYISGVEIGSLSINDVVNTISLGDSNKVYIAGKFTNSVGEQVVSVFDSVLNKWKELGSGFNGDINTSTTDDSSNIYVSGVFRNTLGLYYVSKYTKDSVTSNISNYIKNNDVKLFPNPSTSDITITFKNNDTRILNIFDVTGKVVFTATTKQSSFSINVSTLNSGNYILQSIDNNTISSTKFSKL